MASIRIILLIFLALAVAAFAAPQPLGESGPSCELSPLHHAWNDALTFHTTPAIPFIAASAFIPPASPRTKDRLTDQHLTLSAVRPLADFLVPPVMSGRFAPATTYLGPPPASGFQQPLLI